MIRVWIVDDEIWICQLIRKIIDWEGLGFQIIGESYDGYDAIRRIQEEKPELVLTDIRMPGFDGVELIKRVQGLGIAAQFIIISGHSDFGYAREALKYGALGYILKPIKQDELLFFLKKIKERIFTTEREETQKLELKSKLDLSLRQLREQYFRRLFDNSLGEEALSLQELNQQYGCSFEEGWFRVILYQLDKKHEWLENHEVNGVMLNSLCRYFTEEFEKICFETFTFYKGQQLLQILNYADNQQKTVRKTLEQLRKKINDDQKLELGYELTIGAGCQAGCLEELPKSWESARDGLYLRLSMGCGKMIEASRYCYEITNIAAVFTVEEIKMVECYAKNFDTDGLAIYIHRLFEKILENPKYSPLLVIEIALEVLSIFINTLRQSGVYAEQLAGEWERAVRELETCYQVQQVERCLNRVFILARNNYETSAKSKNDRVIEIVRQYISEHYKEDITLKTLADEVGLNPKYFGEFFKKETGMNYSEYLSGYRVEVAEALLKDVRNRVNEVGYMVGYKDPKYFSKLFKKATGLSPAQYRKLFS